MPKMISSAQMQNANGNAILVIRGAGAVQSVRLRELWQYRELLYFLVWRDIKVRYKQTLLGLVWAVIQPLGIALTLTLFLGRLVKVPSDGLPYPVFAYSAMVIWQLFASALAESSNSLTANERLISKVYFPRLIVPLSSVLTSLLDFVVSLVVLTIFLVYYRIAPSASLLIFPVMVIIAVLLALGVGLWLGALNVKYRDVRYTIGFLVQFWFLATPIAYPANIVPDRWRIWYGLNPMVGIVEGFRWTLRGTNPAPVYLLLVSVCVSVVLLVSGLLYFQRVEDTFADFI